MTAYTWATYPEDQARRAGCKVSWRYYDKREDAEAASRAAENDAVIQSSLGFDFGYCSPGEIRWREANSTPEAGENGRWEVCVP